MNSTTTIPSENNFQTIYTDSDIGAMKSQLYAMTKHRDRIAVDIAKLQNLPNVWTTDMIDWTDPEISHLETTFKNLENSINDLAWDIAEAEATRDGTLDLLHAERVVYKFMNTIPMKVYLKYLLKYGLTTHGLIGKVAENPDYIKETFFDEGE